ncbi:hypothetical protein QFZ30_002447 [Arthrobacter pascens]|uniref:hypothetical protein n=1 Tax=Arthrobacter pascens TaxID=1677 RepID=UPI0027950A32|nr:hypothetical protein [Arthrobacter pascens]MDQ0679065.1 hypothetical protein [Arthrobacter pascens]
MQRSELGPVLEKLELLEGRTFSAALADAWFEILGEHTEADALAAVLAFHSKPFKRPAYPGDIKEHILEVESVRLMRCGTLEANEAEWFNGSTADVYRQLRRLISAGDWSPNDYRLYRRSELTLDQYLTAQGSPVG